MYISSATEVICPIPLIDAACFTLVFNCSSCLIILAIKALIAFFDFCKPATIKIIQLIKSLQFIVTGSSGFHDARTIAEELPESKDSIIIKPYFDTIFENYNFKANANYTNWSNYETELSLKLSLFNYFKYYNSQKRLQRDYGTYLLGDFKNGKYNGADALATYWYNRNLRIFRNIPRVTTSSKNRILVLFGAGHFTILDQLLKCSPEYDYIKFNDLKK